MSTDHQHEHSTYEGRPLADRRKSSPTKGLGFDVVTLMSRRRMLRAFGLGAAAFGLAACSSPTTSTSAGSATASTLAEIPDETAGPFPGNGSNGPDVLEQSGVIRSDIRSSFGESSGTAEGVCP